MSEEQDLQNEVDQILNDVIGLDLGDAVSNKQMKQKVNQFQAENKYLTGQLSHRSKRSNRSHKSLRYNFSRKTKHSIVSNSVPAPRVRGDRAQPGEPAGRAQPSRGALENNDLKDSVKETIRQSKQGLGGLSRHLALSTSKSRLQTSG